jgi:hypothetical protein
MKNPVGGSCVCGAVAFEIEGPYSAFNYCHCSRCRKKSGSAHAVNVFVPPAQLSWTRGEELVRKFELPGAKAWCSAFCSTCGSAMPWLTRSGKMYIVPAGALDDDPGEKPRRNIHFGSRPPWYVHASGLETFDESP